MKLSKSVVDMTTMRVARRVNDLIDVELQAMLLNEGIDPGLVAPYKHQPGVDHLMDDRVQVIPGYSTTVPFLAENHGIGLKEIKPSTYGIDFYGDSIFTRGKLIRTRPDLVERFVRASLKGWEYALEHPGEFVVEISERLVRFFPIEHPSAYNRFQAKEVRRLTLYPVVELGHIGQERIPGQFFRSFQATCLPLILFPLKNASNDLTSMAPKSNHQTGLGTGTEALGIYKYENQP